MFLLCMPYVTFTERGRRANNIRVARATLWPDTDANWIDVVGTARPPWLDIYRDFPRPHEEVVGPPRRGTLVVSTDQEWLRDNARRLVSVLYFLGDRTIFAGQMQYGRPANDSIFSA